MKRLDRYIENQKRVEPSAYLVSRIMTRIESSGRRKHMTLIQSVAVIASLAAIVMIGITIGNEYKTESYLAINDTQIENFSTLLSDDTQ